MNINLSYTRIVQFGLLLILAALTALNAAHGYPLKELSMVICLASSFVLIIKSRHDVGSAAIFLFLLYAMVMISYEFLFGIKTAIMSFYYEAALYNQVICILAFFLGSLAIFLKPKVRDDDQFNSLQGNNSYLLLASLALCAYILVFGVNRGVYESYSVRITSIYEYFILFYLLAFYYSKKTWKSNLLLLGMAAVYILQDFYYGGRISSLQLMILIAILFLHKIKLWKLLTLSVLGYALMNAVELFRNQEKLSILSILNSLFVNQGASYKDNTFSEVLYSSSALVYSSINVFTETERISTFVDFIRNTFSDNRPLGNIIPYISQNISYVGGGGYFPVYFYFWLGWGGVLLASWAAIRMLNVDQSQQCSDYLTLLKILTVAMFPRWFVYTPLIFTRFILLNFSLIFIFYVLFDSITKRSVRLETVT